VLRRHRGLSEHHQKRAIEWFLVLHELSFTDALTHALPATTTPLEPETEHNNEPEEINLYDTATSAEEGLWNRSGWAGRG